MAAKMKEKKTASWLITTAIVLLLVLAGPAQGFVLSLSLDNSSPTKGQPITFTAQVDIEKSEQLPINYLTLKLSGPETQICKFSPSGKILENCKGISIERIQSNFDYGYGYGYGYNYGYEYNFGYGYGYGYGYNQQSGKLVYRITLDTSQYAVGDYQTELKVKIANSEFNQAGPNFSILSSEQTSGHGKKKHKINQCETSWTCTSFGPCINGYQYRACNLVTPECTIYPENPTLAQTCTMQQINFELQNQNSQDEILPESTSQDEISQPRISRITGAVIGTLENASFADLFLIVAGFIIVIGGLSVLILMRKNRLKNRPAFYNGNFR